MSLPVVLDTDIGTDVDDAYALLLAAVSPELNLRGVTTVNNNTALRAKIARKLLLLLGREDVEVAVGSGPSLTPGVTRGWGGHEGQGIDLLDIVPDRDFSRTEGPRRIAEAAQNASAAGTPLTLLTIGALTNVALALEQQPREMTQVGQIIAMASSFEGFGEENARGEHNVACDPAAMERVLDSGIPLTMIGLNVTRQTTLTEAHVEEIAALGGPLAEALVGMHRVWFTHIGRDHSPMHDGLAVAVAFRPELVTLEPVVARVRREPSESGIVEYNPPAPGEVTHCRIATSINADAFHVLLLERVKRAVVSSQ